MKSINGHRCPKIIGTSKFIKNCIKFGANTVNHKDKTFDASTIRDVELLLNESVQKINSKLDFIEDDHIEEMINFCEKYVLTNLETKLKKYYATIVIPALKTPMDIFSMYEDSESDKVVKPNSNTAKKFIKKYKWFLVN
jgi:hypothetical protein